LMKQMGYGGNYRYIHNDPNAKEEMECLPPTLSGARYFVEDEEEEKEEINNQVDG